MHKFKIYNINISCFENRAELKGYLMNSQNSHILTLNGEFLNEAKNNPEFAKIIENNPCTIDTVSLSWIINYLKNKNKNQLTWFISGIKAVFPKIFNIKDVERISGSDLIEHFKLMYPKHKLKILCLGGIENSAEIVEAKFSDDFYIKGFSKFYVKPSELENFNNNEINELLTYSWDFVLVALGAPLQELFIEKYRHTASVGCWIGVGGSFDYWSGKIARAPKIIRFLGLEWLFRLMNEPKRFKRILNAWKPVLDLLFARI